MIQDTVKPLQKPLLDYTAVLSTLDLYQYYSFKQMLGNVQRYQTPELPHWLSSTYWQPVYESLPCRDIFFAEGVRFELMGPFTGPGVFKTPGINQLSQPSKKKMQFPSSTESMSMPISTLSSMLLMVLYEFLQTQKLASLPTGVCIFLSLLLELNQYLLITNQL